MSMGRSVNKRFENMKSALYRIDATQDEQLVTGSNPNKHSEHPVRGSNPVRQSLQPVMGSNPGSKHSEHPVRGLNPGRHSVLTSDLWTRNFEPDFMPIVFSVKKQHHEVSCTVSTANPVHCTRSKNIDLNVISGKYRIVNL